MKKLRVVFMGTPDIAATCLDKIITDGFDVVGIFTQPDRPRGRGMRVQPSPAKARALQAGIPVFQPETFRGDEAVEQLRALAPDVCTVVAYGRILPQRVLDIPRYGCINIHASMLPAYRGCAPYQWAVLNGDTETGVSAQYMAKEMDAGNVIEAVPTPIAPEETAGELLDRLAVLGADLLSRTLTRIGESESGILPSMPQDVSKVTFAPKLEKTVCPIDFTKPAARVHDHIRGLNPWPVATMTLGGRLFKIYDSVVVPGSGEPGKALALTKTGLVVACGEGAVEIRTLQAEGGKRMRAVDYFRGHPLEC